VPRGWFLPVTPGTRFVTVAGAIANDVHGKNHHRAGTFGAHVLAFELLRSDGSRRLCTPERDAPLFRATIGGLGLTGLITWATIRLRRIEHPYIATETIRYDDLGQFFALSAESDAAFEYTVAWVDCLAKGARAGRGVFFRGNHAPAPPAQPRPPARRALTVPLTPPIPLINHLTLAAFNAVYQGARRPGIHAGLSHYEPFFYPLDGIARWNRIYGPKGFLQYQFVVPHETGEAALREVLARIARAGEGSFLAVLKVFGASRSPGLLSFPQPGITLALDFPNRGRRTFALLDALDQVVYAAGGRLYPAKDARMHGADFRRTYPDWTALEELRDPRFDSSFWRRVREGD
jgi:FAD/FMN-containing dehydrogenase